MNAPLPHGASRPIVRPFAPDDLAGVCAMITEQAGYTRSPCGWQWLLEGNPARPPGDPRPTGWVVESDGAIDGYLGNILVDYAAGGRQIKAAVSSAYFVQPWARSAAVPLMSASFRQQGVDLQLTTTANAASAPIYQMFKARAVQDPMLRARHAWIVDDAATLRFAAASGSAAHWTAPLAGIAGPALRAARAVTGFARLPPARWDGEVAELDADAIGRDFDALWTRVRDSGAIAARRDASTLRWRLEDPDLPRPTLLAAHDREGLAGYALAARHRPFAAEVPRYKVFDLMVRPGAFGPVPALLRAAAARAKRERAAIVELSRSGSWLAPALAGLRPLVRRAGLDEHYVKSPDRAIASAMTDGTAWLVTSYDGDTALGFRDIDAARPAAQT